MAIDLETVTLMSTYRVGFLPPADGSLAVGELYIEVTSDGSSPKLHVGTPAMFNFAGDTALLATSADVAGPPTTPPVNTTAPYVSQDGDTMTSTMGTWSGTPTSYSYQWKQDDTANIGTDADTYTVTAGDVGHTVSCVVSATNAAGTTVGPPSNDVTVVEPVTTRTKSKSTS